MLYKYYISYISTIYTYYMCIISSPTDQHTSFFPSNVSRLRLIIFLIGVPLRCVVPVLWGSHSGGHGEPGGRDCKIELLILTHPKNVNQSCQPSIPNMVKQ